jgi:hypothetical protein
MRKIVFTIAIVAAGLMSGGLAFADTAQSAAVRAPSTEGWTNAQLQGDGHVIGKRHTFDEQQAMKEGPAPAIIA